jgi:hypothetical protein
MPIFQIRLSTQYPPRDHVCRIHRLHIILQLGTNLIQDVIVFTRSK